MVYATSQGVLPRHNKLPKIPKSGPYNPQGRPHPTRTALDDSLSLAYMIRIETQVVNLRSESAVIETTSEETVIRDLEQAIISTNIDVTYFNSIELHRLDDLN